MTRRELLEAALKLERTERELLVEERTASLHGGFAGEDIEKAWLDQVDRRSREVDDGTAEVVEWFRRARAHGGASCPTPQLTCGRGLDVPRRHRR